jgi:hypothetical protein
VVTDSLVTEYRITVDISAATKKVLKHKNFGTVGNKRTVVRVPAIVWKSTHPSIQWVLEHLTPEIRLLEGEVYHSLSQVTNIQKRFGVMPAPGSK